MKTNFRNHIFMIIMMALVACVGFSAIAPLRPYAKSVEKKAAGTKAYVDADMNENRAEFLEVCKQMGKNLHDKHFRYGFSSGSKSYRSALKHSRRATCVTFASWCLQEYGVLKKGKLFYGKSSGRPNIRKWNKNRVQLVKVYKRTKHANLKPGDVVCWASGKAHVCIYAGKNSKGKRVWYDAGRHQSTYGHCAGSRYKVVSARHNKYLENRKVGYVLRIK